MECETKDKCAWPWPGPRSHLPYEVFTPHSIHRACFALDRARHAHEEALAIGEAIHHPFVTGWCLADLAADHALAGEWDLAGAYARRALALRNYDHVYPGFARWCETEALLRAGAGEEAAADIAQAESSERFPRGKM